MLTDGLRPPDGYRVDLAVATTYSLDLTALLLAPLSFALFDQVNDQVNDQDLTSVDPIRLLEAVRRHSEHTTVFCQAGAIAVPAAYRSILTFVEECVREVMPPTQERVFHPKIWALRFVNQSGEYCHRFICSSRNLTFDRSWDTALRLDEEPESKQAIDTGPLSDFLAALPDLSTHPLDKARHDKIESLASSMRAARLAPPTPFTAATLVPLGMGQDRWPFPAQADKLLAISPFLDKTSLRRLGDIAHDKFLVSRAETLDRVGGNAVLDWQTQTLQRLVEVEVGDDVEESPTAVDEWQRVPEGLHAKTFVLDVGDQALVVTGSANLTGAAWGGNVEFDVAMTGPVNDCGVVATLEGTSDAPGLSRILEDYEPTNAEGMDDSAQETSWALELFHQQLAASRPELHVTRLDEDRVALQLHMDLPSSPPGETTVWPVSLPRDTHGVVLVGTAEWAAISPRHVTPFIAVETTAGDGDARSTRRCVIEASLHGDVDQRRRDAVAEVLRSKEDVLRYLVFLLGDPSYSALFEQMTGAGEQAFSGWGASGARHDVALFEPLVRATGRDTDALARVASLVSDLKQLPNGDELVPEGFGDLWDVVWQVHQETQS